MQSRSNAASTIVLNLKNTSPEAVNSQKELKKYFNKYNQYIELMEAKKNNE